jgi:hypothetical protein
MIFTDGKITVCNRIIMYSNYFFEPANAFNPILGAVMNKNGINTSYSWCLAGDYAEDLYYQINHEEREELSGNNEKIIVLNKDWYVIKYH